MNAASVLAVQESADVEYLADHSLLLAVPAFVPAIVVVGLVIYLAVRDRRSSDDHDHNHDEES